MRHDLAMGCLALSLACGGAVTSLGGCSERKVDDAKSSGSLAPTLASTPAPDAVQPRSQVVRIGWLSHGNEEQSRVAVAQLQQGLVDLGYPKTKFTIEVRQADGDVGQLPALAASLVAAKMDVIVTSGEPAALAAKEATSTARPIPIVITEVGMDPVKAGIVASLGKPEGNVTGLATMTDELWPKRLELLAKVLPTARRLGVVWNPANAGNADCVETIRGEASRSGMTLRLIEAKDVAGLARSLDGVRGEPIDAVAICWDAMTLAHAKTIADFCAQKKVPSLGPLREYVVAGNLLSLGLDLDAHRRRAASYVDRLVNGKKPSELPVERTSNPMYAYNARTAAAIGVTMPDAIALVAEKVPQE